MPSNRQGETYDVNQEANVSVKQDSDSMKINPDSQKVSSIDMRDQNQSKE